MTFPFTDHRYPAHNRRRKSWGKPVKPPLYDGIVSLNVMPLMHEVIMVEQSDPLPLSKNPIIPLRYRNYLTRCTKLYQMGGI